MALGLVIALAVGLVLVLGDHGVKAGVTTGELTESGRIVVTEDGTVIDSKDVSGPIWVKADNVRIVNSRVTYGGYQAIRVYRGYVGTTVVDTEINCESTKGRGIAYGGYTAERVAIEGCGRGFVTTGGYVTVKDSTFNGDDVEFSIGAQRTSSVTSSPVRPATSTTTTTAASPTTTAGVATPSPTATVAAPAPPPAVGSPAESAVIAAAGPTNPGAMRSSGSITASEDGQVIENVKVSGTVTIKANNVTLRNCEVRGRSSVAVVRSTEGVSGTRIEHCDLEAVPGPNGEGTNGVVQGGKNTYVGYSEITGFADGIKAEDGSTYEHNYIHTYKPSGAEKHLDGIQGSGDSDFTIRSNVIDQPADSGGNSAIFVQSYNGQQDYKISGIVVEGNYLRGGNYTVFLLGDTYMSNFTYRDNRFARDGNRYGYSRVSNCGAVAASGNVFKDDNSPVPGTC